MTPRRKITSFFLKIESQPPPWGIGCQLGAGPEDMPPHLTDAIILTMA